MYILPTFCSELLGALEGYLLFSIVCKDTNAVCYWLFVQRQHISMCFILILIFQFGFTVAHYCLIKAAEIQTLNYLLTTHHVVNSPGKLVLLLSFLIGVSAMTSCCFTERRNHGLQRMRYSLGLQVRLHIIQRLFLLKLYFPASEDSSL